MRFNLGKIRGMKKTIFKLLFILGLIVFNSCDFNTKIVSYDKSLPWENLRESLNQLLIFELNCSYIDYKIDVSMFDEKYTKDFLYYSSGILLDNINENTLLNQEYEFFMVPEEWYDESEKTVNQSHQCQVFFTKLVESKSKNAIFTYVYIPSLDAKYKILYTKDKNNEWKLSAFGM